MFFKKGGIQFGLKQLIYLVLSLIVLSFLFLIGFKLWAQFSGAQIDEASLNNFDNLANEINLLLEDSKKTEIVMPYYVRGEIAGSFQTYGLVGFVGENLEEGIAEKEYIMEGCKGDSRIVKSKCGYSEACLCLVRLERDGAFNQAEVLKCYKNENIIGYFVDTDYKFESPYSGFDLKDLVPFDEFGGSGKSGGGGATREAEIQEETITNYEQDTKDRYSTLVIWGQCGVSWGVKNIVIRKEKIDEDTYRIVFSNQESAGYKSCCCVDQTFVRGCEPEYCGDYSVCEGMIDNKGYALFYYQDDECDDVISKTLGKCSDVRKEPFDIGDECCCVNPIQYNTGCTPKECKEGVCTNQGILLAQTCEEYGITEGFIDEQYCNK